MATPKPKKPMAGVKKRGTPVALPQKTTKPGTVTRKTAQPKPKSTFGPLPSKPTLNDYLKRGMKPPVKKGLKVPSDADVRIKGYNK